MTSVKSVNTIKDNHKQSACEHNLNESNQPLILLIFIFQEIWYEDEMFDLKNNDLIYIFFYIEEYIQIHTKKYIQKFDILINISFSNF